MNEMAKVAVKGEEHWTTKDGGVKLFLWEKCAGDPGKSIGTILFVHGSSMASQPTFDLQVPGRPDSSAMDWFRRAAASTAGASTWRATAARPRTATTTRRSRKAPTTATAAALYIQKLRGKRPLLVYGISSGALRAALFAERHPELVGALALDAMVWTGEGSPTLEQRRKRLPEFMAKNRRPIDKAFVHSIFDRDHPGTAEEAVIEAFADAVVALDNSVPTGTYVDMCANLPVVDPGEDHGADADHARAMGRHRLDRGPDRSSSTKLPNPDKQFAVMPGISHASFQQKNYLLVYHILWSFFTQPAPVYRGA